MRLSRSARIYPGIATLFLIALTLTACGAPSQSVQQQSRTGPSETRDGPAQTAETGGGMEPTEPTTMGDTEGKTGETSGTPMAGMQPADVSALTGFYSGQEVRFIHTEVSNREEANRMTGMGGSQLIFVPSLDRMPEEALGDVYAFTNGVPGSGAKGFQLDVFDSAPGDPGYTPLRSLKLVSWRDEESARVLKSASSIEEAKKNGEIEIEKPGIVFNMPFTEWPGGQR